MPRVCVFCGGTPITREHLWPEWARRLLADAGPLPHRYLGEREGREPVTRAWDSQAYKMTVRAVCASCNNGWMSQLEARAKPLLEPMLHGRGRLLHRESQATLAAWALKTALMWEQSQRPERRVIPETEYDHLFRHGEPSERVLIWMAGYVGTMPGVAHLYGMDADVTQGTERGQRDIWGATIGFGPVAFQLFGTSVAGLLDGFRLGAPPAINVLLPFEAPFTWSPMYVLGDGDFADFMDAIPRTLMRLTDAPPPNRRPTGWR